MSYSADFREIVIKNIDSGMSCSEAMRVFCVSRDSIYRWLSIYAETGSVLDKKRKAYQSKKIDSERLLAVIDKNPDATLEELSKEFDCWPQSIHKRCVRLGITRKKNLPIRGKK